jgi:RNA polymerase sigma factor (sigma-70 family)
LRAALTFTLADADLAAEVVDEAMTRAYARWYRVGRLADPAGWVFHVAMNVARSARRKRRLRPTFDQTDPQVADAGPDTTDTPPELDLWDALTDLPIAQREIVVLRFYLDWPLERIATAVDVPLGTVKSRLHRGLTTLERKAVVR